MARQDLDEQIGALLDLGRRRFGVETALIAQARDGKLRVLDVRSADPRLRRGLAYALDGARRDGPLLRPRGPRGLAHAPFESAVSQVLGAGRADAARGIEPVLRCEGETYLGAPILVEGEVWGGLHFSDADGRAGIGGDERDFLLVMAAWLGGEIERRQARARLEEQQRDLLEVAAKLEALAVRDGLTGVKNRRAFDEALASEWQRACRYKTPLSLILMDVDKFKSYNDTFGHPAGDEVLKQVAEALGEGVRNIDFLARYGGEEFVLLLPSTDAEGALIVAERLRERVQDAPWRLRAVTASFGVATIAREMAAPGELLKAADEALYQSKEGGRNRVTHAQVLAAAGKW